MCVLGGKSTQTLHPLLYDDQNNYLHCLVVRVELCRSLKLNYAYIYYYFNVCFVLLAHQLFMHPCAMYIKSYRQKETMNILFLGKQV